MILPPGVIQAAGGAFVLVTDSHLSRWVEGHGRLDIAADQIAFYAKHIPFGGVVLDAGACIGDHTATYAKLVGPSGQVWAFEPVPESFAALALNFAGHPNVACGNFALSDKAGPRAMQRHLNAGKSHLISGPGISVESITIDSLKLNRLDFMHLDCEGHELQVLRGAVETLGRCRPVIVLEVNHRALGFHRASEAHLRQEMEMLGYRCEEIESHHGPHLPQRDIICFPS